MAAICGTPGDINIAHLPQVQESDGAGSRIAEQDTRTYSSALAVEFEPSQLFFARICWPPIHTVVYTNGLSRSDSLLWHDLLRWDLSGSYAWRRSGLALRNGLAVEISGNSSSTMLQTLSLTIRKCFMILTDDGSTTGAGSSGPLRCAREVICLNVVACVIANFWPLYMHVNVHRRPRQLFQLVLVFPACRLEAVRKRAVESVAGFCLLAGDSDVEWCLDHRAWRETHYTGAAVGYLTGFRISGECTIAGLAGNVMDVAFSRVLEVFGDGIVDPRQACLFYIYMLPFPELGDSSIIFSVVVGTAMTIAIFIAASSLVKLPAMAPPSPSSSSSIQGWSMLTFCAGTPLTRQNS